MLNNDLRFAIYFIGFIQGIIFGFAMGLMF